MFLERLNEYSHRPVWVGGNGELDTERGILRAMRALPVCPVPKISCSKHSRDRSLSEGNERDRTGGRPRGKRESSAGNPLGSLSQVMALYEDWGGVGGVEKILWGAHQSIAQS